MRTKRISVLLLTGALLLVGALGWLLTFGNATWRLHRVFPGARVYFDPINSPDLSFGVLVRLVVPDYFHRSEYVGIDISNHPTPIDFSPVAGFHLHSVHLNRCSVSDIQALLAIGTFATFRECDLSALPPAQRSLLWSPQPSFNGTEQELALNSP